MSASREEEASTSAAFLGFFTTLTIDSMWSCVKIGEGEAIIRMRHTPPDEA